MPGTETPKVKFAVNTVSEIPENTLKNFPERCKTYYMENLKKKVTGNIV